MNNVCIVDDDESARDLLETFYRKLGFSVDVFACPVEALAALKKETTPRRDLVVCDLKMPKLDGLEFIDKLRAEKNPVPVVLLTAHASVESAVEGLSKGAFDYITKPVNLNDLAVISDRAIKLRHLEEDYLANKKQVSQSFVMEEIVGKSAAMQSVFSFIRKVSQVSCNVLITGESGSGKEMVAKAIHTLGPRAKKPFLAINCSAIPETLLESELFGHAKGSFTGATERRRGLLEDANEGTVFLDEIGDMPLLLQVKVLRFLQEKKVKPIGENTYRNVDVRIIAATHQSLEKEVKNKKFREDLYYRLCVAPIKIPPLRDRREDIPLLAEYFLERFSKKINSKVIGFSKAALAKLVRLSWPGNVRELQNTIERLVVFGESSLIEASDIPESEISETVLPTARTFSKLVPLESVEKEYIEYVLDQMGNRQEKAAEILGINRKTLHRKQQLYKAANISFEESNLLNQV